MSGKLNLEIEKRTQLLSNLAIEFENISLGGRPETDISSTVHPTRHELKLTGSMSVTQENMAQTSNEDGHGSDKVSCSTGVNDCAPYMAPCDPMLATSYYEVTTHRKITEEVALQNRYIQIKNQIQQLTNERDYYKQLLAEEISTHRIEENGSQ